MTHTNKCSDSTSSGAPPDVFAIEDQLDKWLAAIPDVRIEEAWCHQILECTRDPSGAWDIEFEVNTEDDVDDQDELRKIIGEYFSQLGLTVSTGNHHDGIFIQLYNVPHQRLGCQSFFM